MNTRPLFALKDDAEVDFTFLRDHLQLSNGNLGAHLERLESAGYISIRKAFVRRRPKTFARLSRPGRRAFEDYIEVLKAVVDTGTIGVSPTPREEVVGRK